jgi:DNA-binding MarR family transcriptional regulator
MEASTLSRRAEEFVGSAAVFTSLVHEVIEAGLLSEIAGTQITFAQLKLLALVDLETTWSVGDAATCLGISDAAASKLVDRLVRHGFLRRTEAADDRRVAELSLTERGRQLLRAYFEARDRRLERLLGEVSSEELERHADFLDRLSVGIRKQDKQQEGICLHCGIYAREHCLLREQAPELCFYTQHATLKRAKGRERHGERHS